MVYPEGYWAFVAHDWMDRFFVVPSIMKLTAEPLAQRVRVWES